MMPSKIVTAHHGAILRNNQTFVHWLSPLDQEGLSDLLNRADYARQCLYGEAVLIAYDGNGPYRHKNVDWLSARLDDYLYIDRIILGAATQGKGTGRLLYTDLEKYARTEGYGALACEVNTIPDNPGSHAFHKAIGFHSIGEETYPDGRALRYYLRQL